MVGWVRNIVVTILVAAVGLAVWKFFGGDMGSFFAAVWGAFFGLVEVLSNVFTQIITTVVNVLSGK